MSRGQISIRQNNQLRTSRRRKLYNRDYSGEPILRQQDLQAMPGKPVRFKRTSYWWERGLVYLIIAISLWVTVSLVGTIFS